MIRIRRLKLIFCYPTIKKGQFIRKQNSLYNKKLIRKIKKKQTIFRLLIHEIIKDKVKYHKLYFIISLIFISYFKFILFHLSFPSMPAKSEKLIIHPNPQHLIQYSLYQPSTQHHPKTFIYGYKNDKILFIVLIFVFLINLTNLFLQNLYLVFFIQI